MCDGLAVVACGVVPSPKSHSHPVTATLSVLASVKVHAVPVVQLGAVKFATGAVLGPVPPSPPQAEPNTSAPVSTASIRIDRIGSSRAKGDSVFTETDRMARNLNGRMRQSRANEGVSPSETPWSATTTSLTTV